jgi:hypothetical protein
LYRRLTGGYGADELKQQGRFYVDGDSSSNPGCLVFVLAGLDSYDCCRSGIRRVRRRLDSES